MLAVRIKHTYNCMSCDPESRADCGECTQVLENAPRCFGICGTMDKQYGLPDDLPWDEWFCSLQASVDDMRCKRRPLTGKLFCRAHEVYVPREIQQCLDQTMIVPILLNHSEDQRVAMFLSEAGSLLLPTYHWQQMLVTLSPGRYALLQGLTNAALTAGHWLRVLEQLTKASFGLNPVGKLPVRLGVLTPEAEERWMTVAEQQKFEVRYVAAMLLRLNTQNRQDAETIAKELKNGTRVWQDVLPEDMVEFIENGSAPSKDMM